jgi:branched-chain amino acid transport system substrate-binding protein
MVWGSVTRARAALAIAGAVVAVTAAGCGSSDDSGSTTAGAKTPRLKELTIGQISPLTGALQTYGPAGAKAGELAVEQIKSAVGKAGADIDVQLVTADDQTTPEGAVSAARKLISSDGASCLSGPWASSAVIPTAQTVAVPQGVPLISPGSGAAEVTHLPDHDLVYRITPSDNLQAVAIRDLIARNVGDASGTVATGGLNDVANKGILDTFDRLWQANGGSVNGPSLYDEKETALDSLATKVTSGNPAAFFISPFPDTWPNLAAALLRTGRFSAKKLYIPNGLALIPKIPSNVPKASLVGATGVNIGSDEKSQAYGEFATLYRRSPKKPADITAFTPQNFDSVMLCFLAAVAAGSNDPGAIANKLRAVSSPPGTEYTWQQLPEAIKALQKGEDINFTGVTGPIDWDANGDPGRVFLDVFTYDAQGTYKVVDQIEVRSEASK